MVFGQPTVRLQPEITKLARWFLGPSGASGQHWINSPRIAAGVGLMPCLYTDMTDSPEVYFTLVNAPEEFWPLEIDFVSIHEGVNTSTPNGRLAFGIFASIAEFERELIRDRVRSGLVAAKTKGNSWVGHGSWLTN